MAGSEIYPVDQFNDHENIRTVLIDFEGKDVTLITVSGSTYTGNITSASKGRFVRLKGSPADYYDSLIDINTIISVSFKAR